MIKKILIITFAFNFEFVLSGDGKKFMRMMTSSIGRTVLQCKKEVTFSDGIIEEFHKFWQPGYFVEEPELGCVVSCVLVTLRLVELNGTLNVNNALAFGKANGADEGIAGPLISAYEECRHSTGLEDPCSAGMHLARCYRDKVFRLQWAPKTGPDVNYDDDQF